MSNKNVVIIAEAGVNHNGDIDVAKKLVNAAAAAGADFVKFQTFNTDAVVTRNAPRAIYQTRNIGDGDGSQYRMLKALELTADAHRVLIKHCDEVGIQFLSTPFDLRSIDLLNELQLPMFKIPSGEITNYPYLVRIAQSGKPVVLSTGMANIEEIGGAFDVLVENGTPRESITLLHCNTEYPTPFCDVNLMAMHQMKEVFGADVGYSDHTIGIEISIAAVALGATVIEKHFTLDCTMPGPDHRASIEPDELKLMVNSIRHVEEAISGSGIKETSPSEKRNLEIVRKSIVAACDIKKGDLFTETNLTTKRPATGSNPMRWNEVIGSEASRDIKKDDMI